MAKIIVLDERITKDNTGIRTINAREEVGVRLTTNGANSSCYCVEFYYHGSYSGESIKITWSWPGNSFSAKDFFQRQKYWGFFEFEALLERLLAKATAEGLNNPAMIASWSQRARSS